MHIHANSVAVVQIENTQVLSGKFPSLVRSHAAIIPFLEILLPTTVLYVAGSSSRPSPARRFEQVWQCYLAWRTLAVQESKGGRG